MTTLFDRFVGIVLARNVNLIMLNFSKEWPFIFQIVKVEFDGTTADPTLLTLR